MYPLFTRTPKSSGSKANEQPHISPDTGDNQKFSVQSTLDRKTAVCTSKQNSKSEQEKKKTKKKRKSAQKLSGVEGESNHEDCKEVGPLKKKHKILKKDDSSSIIMLSERNREGFQLFSATIAKKKDKNFFFLSAAQKRKYLMEEWENLSQKEREMNCEAAAKQKGQGIVSNEKLKVGLKRPGVLSQDNVNKKSLSSPSCPLGERLNTKRQKLSPINDHHAGKALKQKKGVCPSIIRKEIKLLFESNKESKESSLSMYDCLYHIQNTCYLDKNSMRNVNDNDKRTLKLSKKEAALIRTIVQEELCNNSEESDTNEESEKVCPETPVNNKIIAVKDTDDDDFTPRSTKSMVTISQKADSCELTEKSKLSEKVKENVIRLAGVKSPRLSSTNNDPDVISLLTPHEQLQETKYDSSSSTTTTSRSSSEKVTASIQAQRDAEEEKQLLAVPPFFRNKRQKLRLRDLENCRKERERFEKIRKLDKELNKGKTVNPFFDRTKREAAARLARGVSEDGEVYFPPEFVHDSWNLPLFPTSAQDVNMIDSDDRILPGNKMEINENEEWICNDLYNERFHGKIELARANCEDAKRWYKRNISQSSSKVLSIDLTVPSETLLDVRLVDADQEFIKECESRLRLKNEVDLTTNSEETTGILPCNLSRACPSALREFLKEKSVQRAIWAIAKDRSTQNDGSNSDDDNDDDMEDVEDSLDAELVRSKTLFRIAAERRFSEGGMEMWHSEWSYKYRPRSFDEILGKRNRAVANELLAWLREWKTLHMGRRGRLNVRAHRGGGDSLYDDFLYRTESDSDNESELINGCAITGATGSGKTSLVYACAEMLGIKVIEVNAGCKRSRTDILRLFGEATQSKRLKLTKKKNGKEKNKGRKQKTTWYIAEDNDTPHIIARKLEVDVNDILKLNDGGLGCSVKVWKGCLLEEGTRIKVPVLTASEKKKLRKKQEKRKHRSKNNLDRAKKAAEAKADVEAIKESKMSLILFDEVDLEFDEDDGFISALRNLLRSAKCPVIMTAIALPDTLKSNSSIAFKKFHLSKPEPGTLLRWLRTISFVEGISISRRELRQLIDLSNCDIRRCVLELQAWTGKLPRKKQQRALRKCKVNDTLGRTSPVPPHLEIVVGAADLGKGNVPQYAGSCFVDGGVQIQKWCALLPEICSLCSMPGKPAVQLSGGYLDDLPPIVEAVEESVEYRIVDGIRMKMKKRKKVVEKSKSVSLKGRKRLRRAIEEDSEEGSQINNTIAGKDSMMSVCNETKSTGEVESKTEKGKKPLHRTSPVTQDERDATKEFAAVAMAAAMVSDANAFSTNIFRQQKCGDDIDLWVASSFSSTIAGELLKLQRQEWEKALSESHNEKQSIIKTKAERAAVQQAHHVECHRDLTLDMMNKVLNASFTQMYNHRFNEALSRRRCGGINSSGEGVRQLSRSGMDSFTGLGMLCDAYDFKRMKMESRRRRRSKTRRDIHYLEEFTTITKPQLEWLLRKKKS
eukprot:g2746.t1